MKFTPIKWSKVKWLLSNPVFRKKPICVVARIFQWELIRLSNRTVGFLFDGDHRILLRANEGASRLTYYFGTSEPETFEFMDDYLVPGMCVIDVGANIGLNAIYAAHRVGTGGRVLAIEPDPSNFSRIRENIGDCVMPQLHLIEAACGAVDNQFIFVHQNSVDTSRSFVTNSALEKDSEKGTKVGTVTVDRLADEYSLERIDYLKIDVEGFEAEVLLGSLQSLSAKKIGVLHVELDQILLGRCDSSTSKIVDLILSFGYKRCIWDINKRMFTPADGEIKSYYCFFVAPKP
jgi:FkbM family methyltransferase